MCAGVSVPRAPGMKWSGNATPHLGHVASKYGRSTGAAGTRIGMENSRMGPVAGCPNNRQRNSFSMAFPEDYNDSPCQPRHQALASSAD